ncbi:hypothetical protein AC579_420 [Pseudocercospora musae]|uniref:Extracellular membrane protein CFEM domain-containing protein n=1 Tax=Pseudocercospora musae TaxID=113226 RepID=A0A139HJG2_9PEZI|nr:hypothetical protein AC579_420 [Pseudocercospora musae]
MLDHLKCLASVMKYPLVLLSLLLAAATAAPAALEAIQNVCTPACGSKTAACCSGDAPFGGVVAFEGNSCLDNVKPCE